MLAFGKAALPRLQKAAERHVETYFGDRIKDLTKLGKKKAVVQAMYSAWLACTDLILREIEYLGEFEREDPDFKAYFEPVQLYAEQPSAAAELLKPLLEPRDTAPDPNELGFSWTYMIEAPEMPNGFSWGRIAQRYRKQLNKIRAADGELRGQLDSENLQEVRALLESQVGVVLEADERRYGERMREKYRVIDLSAMLPPTADETNQVLLRQAFVPQSVREDPPPVELPKDLLRQLVEEGVHDGKIEDELAARQLAEVRESYSERPAEPVLEVVSAPANRKLVLLGGAGSGKSTLLRYLLLTTLQGPKAGKQHIAGTGLDGYLPLLIELREFQAVYGEGRCSNFLEFWDHLGKAERMHLSQKWLHQRLGEGPSLVLFDGLDEIFDSRSRERVMQAIVGFAGDYPKARILVTSRPVGYRDTVFRSAEFRHFALEDLDRKQIETFVEGWFHHLFPDRPKDAEQRRQRILDAVERSRPIRLLAGNPMLLTIMALVVQLRDLPRERWRFYEHAAEVLCHHWDVNRHLEAEGIGEYIGLEDKKELLERIAAHMQAGEAGLQGNVIREQDLQQEIESYLRDRYGLGPADTKPAAVRLISQLRVRNYVLCLRGPKLYGFLHRTFLEYFSANGLVRRIREDPQYSIEHLRDQVFAEHWRDDSWREVIRLIAGMVGDKQAAVLIRFLAESAFPRWLLFLEEEPPKHLALALECLADVRSILPLEQECRILLSAIVESCTWSQEITVEPWSRLLRERILPAAEEIRLPVGIEDWFARAAASSLLRVQSLDAQSLLAQLFIGWMREYKPLAQHGERGENQFTRIWALSALATRCREDLGTFNLISQICAQDENEYVRIAAVKALAKSWGEDPNALQLITQRCTKDKSEFVRIAALNALAKSWSEDPKTLKLITQRSTCDKSDYFRRAALKALAKRWSEEPSTHELITQRCTHDESDYVRRAALNELTERWSEDPSTHELITQRCTHDESESVRRAALDALAKRWSEDPYTFKLIKRRCAHDKSAVVRGAALNALAKRWSECPSILELIAQRCTQDASSIARGAALDALDKSWSEDPKTLELIAQRCIQDENYSIRCAALGILAERWRDEPDTLKLVTQSCAQDENEHVRIKAIKTLAKGWRDAPGTLELITQRCTRDENEHVRLMALDVLAKGWRQDPSVLNLLLQRCVQDENEYIRSTALNALARGWGEDRGVLRLIAQRCTLDMTEEVRLAALDVLAKGWRQDPSVLELITQRCTKDESQHVRSEALDLIVNGWPEDPNTLNLVTQRCIHDRSFEVRREALHALGSGWSEDPSTLELIAQRCTQDENEHVRRSAVGVLARSVSGYHGLVLISEGLDGCAPFLDPLEPWPECHLESGSRRLNLSKEEACEAVAPLLNRLVGTALLETE